jgi:hypothetical protein
MPIVGVAEVSVPGLQLRPLPLPPPPLQRTPVQNQVAAQTQFNRVVDLDAAQRRAADLEEARRIHEALPPIIEVGFGTCSDYVITTNVIGTNNTNITTTVFNMDNDNSLVWPHWNVQYTATSAASITYGNSSCWPFNTIGTGGIGTANTVDIVNHFAWNAWVDRYERIKEAGDLVNQVQRYSRRKLSEEELLAALEQEKRARAAAEKAALDAKMAEKRSNDLLRMCLSPQQIEDYEKKKCFYVEIAGKAGKKERYRIDHGSHGNVKQIDDKGSIIRSFCIQPSGVPLADVLLTQKLWLEASEETREEFWATANVTTLMREKEVPHTVPRRERRKYAEVHGLLH